MAAAQQRGALIRWAVATALARRCHWVRSRQRWGLSVRIRSADAASQCGVAAGGGRAGVIVGVDERICWMKAAGGGPTVRSRSGWSCRSAQSRVINRACANSTLVTAPKLAALLGGD
ncbi:MAG: hypothetical protein M3186_17490 [Actinomycetota bacterium]|nr:hypothetical protein [Actinomycetota bacterium]